MSSGGHRVPRFALAFITLAALLTPLSGQATGALAGQHDVRVVKTEWFDIIYPAESAPAAKLLRDNLDGLYTRAAAQFGGAPEFRMPLVITPSTDILNGYFNPVPYNHIVLYDALPDYSLAHNGTTLLSVVYHELIHAVTMSKKSPIMKWVAKIFGDGYTWTELNTPPSVYEGTAVAMESLEDGFDDGGGRLNSDFALHILRQAKIEGKFPSWDDATGFRDTYNGGSLPYIIGGAFTDYLIETYGMELFQDFWNKSAFFGKGFSPAAFKSVFPVPIRDAWKNFIDSIIIPETADPPITEITNRGFYTQVISSPKGAAWLDTSGGTVWHVPAGSPRARGSVKPRKLLSLRGLRSISYSLDGRYLGLSRNTQRGRALNEALVYDTESRRLLKVHDERLRDTAVVTLADGFPYVCAVKSLSQRAALVYYPLQKDELRKGAIAYRYDFPLRTIPFNPVDMGQGRTAFLLKEGIRWSIAMLDAITGEMSVFDAPEPEIELRYLNAQVTEEKTTLHFSWTQPGSLPRLGSLEFEKASLATAGTAVQAQWRLLDQDISGGIYSPAPLQDGAFLYGAKFFEGDAVRLIDTAHLPVRVVQGWNGRYEAQPPQAAAPAPLPLPDSKRYIPFRYWNRPLILPVAVVPVRNSAFEMDTGAIPLGVSFAFDDPGDSLIFIASAAWDASAGINATGAWDEKRNNLYAAGTVLGGNDLFFVDADYTFTYAHDRFTRNVARAALSSLVDLPHNFTVTFSNTAFWSGVNDLSDNSYYNNIQDTTQISFSNLRRYGKSLYQSGGITLAPFYQIAHSDTRGFYQNIGLDASVSLPQILPFRNPEGFTVNLPLTAGAYFFPNRSVFVQAYLSGILFSAEIQRAIPYVPLFIRRVSIQAQYIHREYHDNGSFDIFHLDSVVSHSTSDNVPADDTLVLAFIPELGINTGALSNVGFQVKMDFRFNLNAMQLGPTFGVSVGLRY